MEINTVNTNVIKTRNRYKDKIDPHAIVLDVEIELQSDINTLSFNLVLRHQIGKEIALFLFGRKGAGHVDPQIIDNIDYSKMNTIPRYRSFENGDRRYEIVIKTNFEHGNEPIENLVSSGLEYQFKDNYVGNSSKFIMFCFPCLVSLTSLSLHQKSIKSNGNWKFEVYDEKTGSFNTLTTFPQAFNTTHVPIILEDDNYGRSYRLIHISGNIDKTAIILPVRFQLKQKTIEF